MPDLHPDAQTPLSHYHLINGSPERPGGTVRLLHGRAGLAQAAVHWQALEAHAPHIFQRYDFAREWAAFFGLHRNLVLIEAENGRGRALLPLLVEPCGKWPRTSAMRLFNRLGPSRRYHALMYGVRALERLGIRARGTQCRLIGENVFDEMDLLVQGDVPVAELAQGLRRLNCQRLIVDSASPGSQLAQILPQLFGRVFQRHAKTMPLLHARRLQLEALRKAHPRTAKEHRRLLRRGGRIQAVLDRGEASRILRHAFELKRAQQRRLGRPTLYADRRYEHWLLGMVRRRLGDWVHLLVLSIDDQFAACTVYFDQRDCWRGYFTAYEPRFAKQSPGTVLMWEVIERAVEQKLPVLNFGAGEDAHKAAWQDDVLPLISIEATELRTEQAGAYRPVRAAPAEHMAQEARKG